MKTAGQPGRLVLVVVAHQRARGADADRRRLEPAATGSCSPPSCSPSPPPPAGGCCGRCASTPDSATRLAHQATHDALTGLPNRVYLHEYLTEELTSTGSTATEPSVALLFLDLDRFKLVNDTLGHGIGDELLIAVAERLRANMPPGRPRRPHRRRRVRHRASPAPATATTPSRSPSGPACAFMAPFARPRPRDPDLGQHRRGPARGRTRPATPRRMLRDADTAMYQAKDAGRRRRRASSTLDARAGRPPARARARAAPRARAGRAAPLLPADRPASASIGSTGLRGAAALVAPDARARSAADVFMPDRRGHRPHRRDRRLGDRRGVRRRCAALRAEIGDGARPVRWRSTSRPASSATTALLDHVGPVAGPPPALPASALCLELTESLADGEPERSSPSCWPRCARAASGSPSTTSAPATRRSPTSSSCRSTRSRSTAVVRARPRRATAPTPACRRGRGHRRVARHHDRGRGRRDRPAGERAARARLPARPRATCSPGRCAEDALPAVLERLGLATDAHLRVVRDLGLIDGDLPSACRRAGSTADVPRRGRHHRLRGHGRRTGSRHARGPEPQPRLEVGRVEQHRAGSTASRGTAAATGRRAA